MNMHIKLIRVSFLLAACAACGAVVAAPSFSPPVDHPVGEHPGHVQLVDVNGDGAADVVTTDRDADGVSVLLADGSGGFASASSYDAGTAPQWVVCLRPS